MFDIVILGSRVQFKNPVIGQPTRPIKDHYYARRIIALVDGIERQFRFMDNEIPFEATEEDMVEAVENKLTSEQKQEQPNAE